jgi:hypothetical protein
MQDEAVLSGVPRRAGAEVDSVLEGKNTLPVVLHADDQPAIQ